MEREPNTQYVLSLSYGKDSLATIEACKRLGYPIDRIIHAEIWATDDIHADLPPMVEFKSKADAIIKERYGIEVEHVCAMAKDGTKQTYEKLFYHIPKRRKAERERERETILGFPQVKGNWCTSNLKRSALRIPNNIVSMVRWSTQDALATKSKDFQERQSQHGARLSKSNQCVFG